MEKLSESIIEELVQQKLEGESYSRIRSGLAEQGFTDEEIRSSIRKIDERVLRAEIEQGSRNRAKSWYRIGLALAVAGLILTIGSNAGWMLKGIPGWVIYSPFFAGILIMYYGKRLQIKQSNPFEKGADRIRKKRPYK
ncbi:MAG: hypothetical protein ABFS38_00310 [Bacteroidota bacterium]